MPYKDPTTFGGSPSDAPRRPDGQPRRITVKELAQEMRQAGLREAAGLPHEVAPEYRPRQTGKRVN